VNQTIRLSPLELCFSFQDFNLSFHPFLTSAWMNFSFDTSSISQLYDAATYTQDELISAYVLDADKDNIEIVPSLHFSYGRCFTLKPKKSTNFPVIKITLSLGRDKQIDLFTVEEVWLLSDTEPRHPEERGGDFTAARFPRVPARASRSFHGVRNDLNRPNRISLHGSRRGNRAEADRSALHAVQRTRKLLL
jgi:hypothetical protein